MKSGIDIAHNSAQNGLLRRRVNRSIMLSLGGPIAGYRSVVVGRPLRVDDRPPVRMTPPATASKGRLSATTGQLRASAV
jgi:hypothetical protein